MFKTPQDIPDEMVLAHLRVFRPHAQLCDYTPAAKDFVKDQLMAALKVLPPIPMVLHCPACNAQHIDTPYKKLKWHVGDQALTLYGIGTISRLSSGTGFTEAYFADLKLPEGRWAVNTKDLMMPIEPHRSHKCVHCGNVWRPADVCTVGVSRIETKEGNDNPPVQPKTGE